MTLSAVGVAAQLNGLGENCGGGRPSIPETWMFRVDFGFRVDILDCVDETVPFYLLVFRCPVRSIYINFIVSIEYCVEIVHLPRITMILITQYLLQYSIRNACLSSSITPHPPCESSLLHASHWQASRKPPLKRGKSVRFQVSARVPYNNQDQRTAPQEPHFFPAPSIAAPHLGQLAWPDIIVFGVVVDWWWLDLF